MAKTAAAAAVAAEPAPAPTARHTMIPLAHLRESPSNHRRTWGDMDELAASVRRQGVLQPVLARPTGEGEFELVFGHRRFRAAQAVGLAEIPAMVREMTDLEVLEAQVVENLQRQDVHPLEEAEGYEQLLQQKERPYTVDDIAAKVGKSKAYVYGRMKLLALCPEARKAFYEGKLTASTALEVARISNADVQLKALREITEGEECAEYHTGKQEFVPLSARDAHDLIVRQFMLRLAEAPFDRADPELVPGAGVCTSCPKRSGNQPELFADAKTVDLCTDPDCFAAKKDANWKRQAAAAEANGAKVLTAKESGKVFDRYSSDGVKYDAPYVDLAARCPDDPKGRTWKQVLGKDLPEKAVARDPRGKVHELVPREVAIAAAKEAGVAVRKPAAAPPAYDREKYQRDEKVRREAQRRIAAALVARFEKVEPDTKLWRVLVDALSDNYDIEEVLFRRFAPDEEDGSVDPKVVEAAIAKMKEPALRGFALELSLASAIYCGLSDATNAGKALLAWAKLDAKAVEKDVRTELAEQERAAKKKATGGVNPDALVGTREAAIAKHQAKKPLEWSEEDDGRVLGVAANGLVYAIESYKDGFRWVQGKKRSGPFIASGGKGALAIAKEDAERAELERSADNMLKNAGAGEFTKADTKGAAVARKKGGRR